MRYSQRTNERWSNCSTRSMQVAAIEIQNILQQKSSTGISAPYFNINSVQRLAWMEMTPSSKIVDTPRFEYVCRRLSDVVSKLNSRVPSGFWMCILSYSFTDCCRLLCILLFRHTRVLKKCNTNDCSTGWRAECNFIQTMKDYSIICVLTTSTDFIYDQWMCSAWGKKKKTSASADAQKLWRNKSIFKISECILTFWNSFFVDLVQTFQHLPPPKHQWGPAQTPKTSLFLSEI